MKYLKLVRYQNLLMLAFMQLLLRYGFLKFQNIPSALADWQYGLLVLATVLIAAGGYVINDVMDQDTDNDNGHKKVIVGQSVSEATAYNIYIVLNIVGVGAGFYLSNIIQRPGFAAVFVVVAATLYLYATSLKQMILVGNIIVALLLSFSVMIVGIFDIFPATFPGNQREMATVFSILTDYAIFAFLINLLREIVKDLEDVDGDYNNGMNTLPIVLGVGRTAKLTFGLSFIPIVVLLYYTNAYFVSHNLWILTGYTLFFLVAPLLYFAVKMYSAKKQKDFAQLSGILKITMLFGILSIAVMTYNLLHHA